MVKSHGLFPLPLLGDLGDRCSPLDPAMPRYIAQRRAAAGRRDDRVRESLAALNGLASARAGAPLAPVAARRADGGTEAQVATVKNVRRLVRQLGVCPADLSGRGALQELLRTSDIYGGAGGTGPVPFDAQKVKVLSSRFSPNDVERVCPRHVVDILADARRSLEKPTAEVESEGPPIEPYWDPTLDPRKPANRARTLDFVRSLVAAGLVGGRLKKKADIGIFFVPKKGGAAQRMVLDARQTNSFHKPAPYTAS